MLFLFHRSSKRLFTLDLPHVFVTVGTITTEKTYLIILFVLYICVRDLPLNDEPSNISFMFLSALCIHRITHYKTYTLLILVLHYFITAKMLFSVAIIYL